MLWTSAPHPIDKCLRHNARNDRAILALCTGEPGDMTPRAVIVHSLEQARAALAAAEARGVPIALYSAEGAAGSSGIGWFASVIEAARAEHPRAVFEAVLDCGSNGALAVAALRGGWRAIVFRGTPALRRKLAAIAAGMAARIDGGASGALDLRHCAEPNGAVIAWLTEG